MAVPMFLAHIPHLIDGPCKKLPPPLNQFGHLANFDRGRLKTFVVFIVYRAFGVYFFSFVGLAQPSGSCHRCAICTIDSVVLSESLFSPVSS